MPLVLYSDGSGVFGEWYKGAFGRWKFKKRVDVDLSDEDMIYLVKQLKKIKKSDRFWK